MKLKEKGAPKDANGQDAPGLHYPWEGSLKALATDGAFDLVGLPKGAERGPDQPGAQSPAPGVAPAKGGEEVVIDGEVLTNLSRVSTGTPNGGLPRDPEPMTPIEPAKDAEPKTEPTVKPVVPAKA